MLVLPFAVGLCLLLSCTVAPQLELGWHDRQRIAQLGLYVILVLTLLVSRFRKSFEMSVSTCSGAIRAATGSAIVAGVVSASLAMWPRWALLELTLSVLCIALAIGIAVSVRGHEPLRERWLIAGTASLAIGYAVVVLARITPSVIVGEPLYVSHLFEGFSNPRFFGQVQSILIPVLAAGVLVAPRSTPRWLLITVLSVWWFFVFLASTRGTWVGLIAGACFALLVIPRFARPVVATSLKCAIVGMVLYAAFVVKMSMFGNAAEPIVRSAGSLSTTHDRLHLWGMAIDIVQAHPWFGIGPMHFAYERNPYGAHPHNFILQWLAEWGIPATLCLLTATALALKGWCKFARGVGTHSPERGYVIAALTASVGSALTQSLVDGVLVMPYSQVLFATLCGWMLGIYQAERLPATPLQRPAARVWVGAAAFVGGVLGILMYCIYPEVSRLIAWEEASAAARTPEGFIYYFPRFWIQGWIGALPSQ